MDRDLNGHVALLCARVVEALVVIILVATAWNRWMVPTLGMSAAQLRFDGANEETVRVFRYIEVRRVPVSDYDPIGEPVGIARFVVQELSGARQYFELGPSDFVCTSFAKLRDAFVEQGKSTCQVAPYSKEATPYMDTSARRLNGARWRVDYARREAFGVFLFGAACIGCVAQASFLLMLTSWLWWLGLRAYFSALLGCSIDAWPIMRWLRGPMNEWCELTAARLRIVAGVVVALLGCQTAIVYS